MFTHAHIPAHKGRRVTADPLISTEQTAKVKELLKHQPRNLALWLLATNSMLRAGDLTRLLWSDLQDDGSTFTIRLQTQKTKRPMVIRLPEATYGALKAWQVICPSDWIFSGQRGPLGVAHWSRMVKDWCQQVGFDGNFSSHTCRKTGARVRYENGVNLATLMHILGHSDERTSLIYLGKMDERVKAAFELAV